MLPGGQGGTIMDFIAVLSGNWHHTAALKALVTSHPVYGATQAEELFRIFTSERGSPLVILDTPLGSKGIASLRSRCPASSVVVTTSLPEMAREDETLRYIPWKTLNTPETITELLGPPRSKSSLHVLVGKSPVMEKVRQEIAIAARSNLPVHLYGETGTGKEIAAHLIHQTLHPDGPDMVIANCSDLSDTLARCKLFGTRKGAFTDAKEDTMGLVEMANGSTLFLDELEDLCPTTQSLLLRLLEHGTYQRVGESVTRHARFHLLTASNVPLSTLRMTGRLRSDLFYRLYGYPVKMPPLRSHKEDIPLLVSHFLQNLGEPRPVTEESLGRLESLYWQGNVRELFSVLKQAIARSVGKQAISIEPEILEADEQPLLPFPW
jgi:DNA-binding NtrC family response regulator